MTRPDSEAFTQLVEQCRNGRIVPYIGAGMSAPYGYALWRTFLIDLADGSDRRESVEHLLDDGGFEAAAELLRHEVGRLAFDQAVTRAFAPRPTPLPEPAAVDYLPFTFDRVLMTTNLDRVLEYVYARSDKQLTTFWEARAHRLRSFYPDQRQYLFKVHGSVEAPDSRVLTSSEFDRAYDGDGQTSVAKLLEHTVSSIPLLFLGCSLDNDRIMKTLRAAVERNDAVRHFAMVPLPDDPVEKERRRRWLGEHYISPIWYVNENDTHAGLAELLDRLACAVRPGIGEYREAVDAFHRQREASSAELAVARFARLPSHYPPSDAEVIDIHLHLACERIAANRPGKALDVLTDLARAGRPPDDQADAVRAVAHAMTTELGTAENVAGRLFDRTGSPAAGVGLAIVQLLQGRATASRMSTRAVRARGALTSAFEGVLADIDGLAHILDGDWDAAARDRRVAGPRSLLARYDEHLNASGFLRGLLRVRGTAMLHARYVAVRTAGIAGLIRRSAAFRGEHRFAALDASAVRTLARDMADPASSRPEAFYWWIRALWDELF